ncbi:MAG: hydroxymethylbilane synthase, partial [Rhodospirillales bacterium]|nr:hydroxymethylbilane synthase [Rhodospirillales bacterium]
PAAGQGIIAIECRLGDARADSTLAALNDAETAAALLAERAVLAVLDGSCRTPIAAFAQRQGADRLRLRALIALPDGSRSLSDEESGDLGDAAALGAELGRRLLERADPDFLKGIR